jgi:hypothetical protein
MVDLLSAFVQMPSILIAYTRSESVLFLPRGRYRRDALLGREICDEILAVRSKGKTKKIEDEFFQFVITESRVSQ